jgi:hypothetical protein
MPRTVRVIQFRTNYKLSPGRAIDLKIKYGYAQVGGSAVKVGQTVINASPPDSENYTLNDPTAGQVVLIKSVVTDVNDATNQCSVVYSLTGGVVDQQFISEGETEQDGDPILFYSWITFVA